VKIVAGVGKCLFRSQAILGLLDDVGYYSVSRYLTADEESVTLWWVQSSNPLNSAQGSIS